jgi:hypothetical protein
LLKLPKSWYFTNTPVWDRFPIYESSAFQISCNLEQPMVVYIFRVQQSPSASL